MHNDNAAGEVQVPEHGQVPAAGDDHGVAGVHQEAGQAGDQAGHPGKYLQGAGCLKITGSEFKYKAGA